MRLIESFPTNKGSIKVYFNFGNDEYVVRVIRDGRPYGEADYFTDDKDDALATARVMAVSEDKA